MNIFKSFHSDIDVPEDITTWDWLFNSTASPLDNHSDNDLASFTDAVSKERLGWRQVKDASTHISTALVKRYGLKPGDTLSLFSRNTIWYPVMMFAGIRGGGQISGASPAYNADEMTYALKTANARFLATSSTSIEVAAKAAANVGLPKDDVFLLEGELPGHTTIRQLISMGQNYGNDQTHSVPIPVGKKNKDVCAFLSFSSGTTGLPKAIMISHQNVIAQVLQVTQIMSPDVRRVLAALPFFHITGLVHSLHVPIKYNAEVVMLPNFTMPLMLSVISEYRITEPMLVPPIVIRLVRDPIVKSKEYDLSCLKAFSCGAAPLSEEILYLLQEKFPGIGFKQGYGMTESCSCITMHPPSFSTFRYAHSVGPLVASTFLKVIAPDGTALPRNTPGEILAKGPQCCNLGYLNNPKATAETFDADGWLHTGDVGHIDEEGMVTITDRIKELVKVKGNQVAPAELEDLLLGNDRVEDCAVMGVPDAERGEVPKAFVVLKTQSQSGDLHDIGRELLQYVRDRKVRYKWIYELEMVDEIPKSASGKILRRLLKNVTARSAVKNVIVRADDPRLEDKAKL